jgi:hypothetical protein
LALELADGVVEGCCRVVVVAVELVVLPWLLSAATNENRPARPIAPAIAQRLSFESRARPRSREEGVRVVMAPGSVPVEREC